MITNVERAYEEWVTVIDPFPIGGSILFFLYFKHRTFSFKFFHRSFGSLHEARQEQKVLTRDLSEMRRDKFLEKYRIGYDLKGSL